MNERLTMSTLDTATADGVKATPPTREAAPASLAAIKTGLFDDVEVTVTVHLGEAVMSIAELCGLDAGSIVKLDLKLNEPATLFLKDRPIARGEIVAVDDNFALRITEIAPVDR